MDQRKSEPILEQIQIIRIVPFSQQLLQHHLMLLHIRRRASVEGDWAMGSVFICLNCALNSASFAHTHETHSENSTNGESTSENQHVNSCGCDIGRDLRGGIVSYTTIIAGDSALA